MTDSPKISSDINKSAGNKMPSLFVRDVSYLLFHTSFYLPTDVLKKPEFVVERVAVISNEEFKNLRNTGATITYDGNYELVKEAKFVGVSKRHWYGTNTDFYVVKVWYGNPPKGN